MFHVLAGTGRFLSKRPCASPVTLLASAIHYSEKEINLNFLYFMCFFLKDFLEWSNMKFSIAFPFPHSVGFIGTADFLSHCCLAFQVGMYYETLRPTFHLANWAVCSTQVVMFFIHAFVLTNWTLKGSRKTQYRLFYSFEFFRKVLTKLSSKCVKFQVLCWRDFFTNLQKFIRTFFKMFRRFWAFQRKHCIWSNCPKLWYS